MSLESRAGPAGEVVLGCSGRDLTQQLRMGMEVKGGGGGGRRCPHPLCWKFFLVL